MNTMGHTFLLTSEETRLFCKTRRPGGILLGLILGRTKTKVNHFRAMRLSTKFAIAAVSTTIAIAGLPAKAAPSRCQFQGVPPAICSITYLPHAGGWTKEILIEPNGTKRVISREIRGNNVQINLFAPGQSNGSFHHGTYTVNGYSVSIFVDGGTFSYTTL